MKNNTVLHELELVLAKAKRKSKKLNSVYDFVGIWNKAETKEIKKAIAETCEQIDKDEWK